MSKVVLAETGPLVPGVRRIAVLRANALGDYIVTLPALDALRTAYPEAEIVLLGTPMHRQLLDGRPGPVDRVVVVPPSTGVRDPEPASPEDPEALEAFFTRMRAERFDLAVQLHGGGRWSNPFLLRLGAGTTVGLRASDAAPLDRSVPYVYYQHEVLRFLEVVALVGATPVTLEPSLEVTPADRAEADLALPGLPGPVVVVHPGAKDLRRRWPVENFAAVAGALVQAGASVVVTGDAIEQTVVDDLVRRMRHPASPLCGVLSLGGLAGVLERSVVVVANDTGPRHLAAAVGTATVAVYWCGNLVNAGPLTRARHRPHISWRMHCPLCGVECMGDLYPSRGGGVPCTHQESFVEDVTVAEVLRDALELMAREGAADAQGGAGVTVPVTVPKG